MLNLFLFQPLLLLLLLMAANRKPFLPLFPAHFLLSPRSFSLRPLSLPLDRLALGLIEWAEECGKLKKGQTVVEASSGNTGILQTHTFLFRMHCLYICLSDS